MGAVAGLPGHAGLNPYIQLQVEGCCYRVVVAGLDGPAGLNPYLQSLAGGCYCRVGCSRTG